jgi:hypothetical protein
MLTEFGGIALRPGDTTERTWGYSVCATAEEFAAAYERLLASVRQLALLSGFCYTQFTDTYQEANGLLHADRTPKFAIARIRAATAGPTAPPSGLDQVELASPPELR